MNDELQLKVQAFLDGELPEDEAREIAALLARDPDATALSVELRNTRKALAGFEQALKLPESREFYWSKIAREVERLEPVAAPAEAPSLLARLRRFLLPATAVAAAAALAIVALNQNGPAGGSLTEMTSADPEAFTYHDYASGTTLVWVSYPAER